MRRDKLEKALKGIVAQLKEMGAIKIILFGSFISGKVTASSDLDILVIMPGPESGKLWLKKIYRELDRSVASDILAFNVEEFRVEKNKNFLLKEVNRKGRVVYEKGMRRSSLPILSMSLSRWLKRKTMFLKA